jgi:hypothetical protein
MDQRPVPSPTDAFDLKTSWLYCLLVQVRDDTAADVRRNGEQAMAVCQRRGVIMDIMASVQLVIFGYPDGTQEQCRTNGQSTAAELQASLGDDVRVVAFYGDVTHGLLGTKERFDYATLLPKFDRFLSALLATEWGRVTEFGPLS